VINQAELQAGRTGWTFYFYLPAKKQLAAVIADRAGGARVAGVQPWETPPDGIDDQKWQQDSPVGISGFLDKCRGGLAAQPDRQAIVRLSASADNAALVWNYRVVSPDQQAICEYSIDGNTGAPR
jgi:hypothetical protein